MRGKLEDNMEVRYIREMRQNYLVLEVEEGQEQGYEAKMMIGNTVDGLLKFRIKKTDNRSQFCYEITSRQPLNRLLENRTINNIQIRSLLLGIARTLTTMEDYLLTEEQILLDPDYIYIDPEEYRPFLCLVPGKHGNFPEELSSFLQYLLGKADHQDKEAVVLIYGLYRESLKENYGLDNLLSWLTKENCPNVGTVEEREPCETILSQRIETWEIKEPSKAPSYGAKVDVPEKKPFYWYCLPAAVMFALAGALGVFLGMSAFIAYGIWLAGIGICLFVIGTIFYVLRESGGLKDWLSHEKSSHNHPADSKASYTRTSYSDSSMNQTSCVFHTNPQLSQQIQGDKPPEKILVQPGPWQMLFQEEEKSELQPESCQEEAEEMNTMVLWNQEKVKKVRSLVRDDGSSIELSYYPFIIGKQEGLCDHVISKSTVSRLHLRIDETEGGCRITDLNSTNGTYLNGRCLNANEAAPVQEGDEIGIADLKFRLI